MNDPIPQGNYVIAKRAGGLIFTSGITPRRDGTLIVTGQVPAEGPLDAFQAPVEQACANALRAARSQLQPGEVIAQIINLTVYICAAPGFSDHAKLADFASDYFLAVIGDGGIGARAAIGVATLPGNAPVEVQLVAAV